jgi:hypothetical protein
VVVIIKHAHTKTSLIHTRLGSVTKPPGPVTHGIGGGVITREVVSVCEILYLSYRARTFSFTLLN